MGLLDGKIADAIYKGFKGKLSVGLIRVKIIPSSGALDPLGDPMDFEPTDYPCEGFVEDASEYFRAQSGVPDADAKVNIFAKSTSIAPGIDDRVKFTRAGIVSWYQLRRATIDPAGAMWVCAGVKIADPGAS